MLPPDSNERFHLAGNVLSRFKDIHTFIFDVDGVLTNGNVLVTENGELLRSMSVRDGQALRMAVDEGFRILILTITKNNQSPEKRPMDATNPQSNWHYATK